MTIHFKEVAPSLEFISLFQRNIAETRDTIDGSLLFDIDWELGKKFYDAGSLCIVGAFDKNTLIGYHICVISPDMLLAKACPTADTISLYLDAQYRKGWAGYKLVKKTAKILKDKGVKYFWIGVKQEHPYLALFERQGFRLAEYRLVKEL